MTANGDLEAAHRLAEASLKRSLGGSLSSLGEIYRRQGHYALSAAKYRELIAFTPGRSDNAVGLGRTLALMGDTKGAEEQFKSAIDFGPKIGAPQCYWDEMLATAGD